MIACLYERGDRTAYETITCARLRPSALAGGRPVARRRRIQYNLDGDSCLFLKKGSRGPEPITANDLKRVVWEITRPGGQVDTLLVCVNAMGNPRTIPDGGHSGRHSSAGGILSPDCGRRRPRTDRR
jgi:hypothetical protein